jgi:hypothetical protein
VFSGGTRPALPATGAAGEWQAQCKGAEAAARQDIGHFAGDEIVLAEHDYVGHFKHGVSLRGGYAFQFLFAFK